MGNEKAERIGKQVGRAAVLIDYQSRRVNALATRLELEREILARLHNERARLSERFDQEVYGGPRPVLPPAPSFGGEG